MKIIIILLIIIISSSKSFNATIKKSGGNTSKKITHDWEPRISLPGQCGPREYYNECGSHCRLDCYTIVVPFSCIDQECVSGCFCRGGFLRNGKEGPCVIENDCNKK